MSCWNHSVAHSRTLALCPKKLKSNTATPTALISSDWREFDLFLLPIFSLCDLLTSRESSRSSVWIKWCHWGYGRRKIASCNSFYYQKADFDFYRELCFSRKVNPAVQPVLLTTKEPSSAEIHEATGAMKWHFNTAVQLRAACSEHIRSFQR